MTELALPPWAALTAAVLLIFGGLLSLVGALGLFRLRHFYARMHPVTMGATLGTGYVLIASMLVFSIGLQRPVIHELLITLFVVITAPISAMTLMRAALTRSAPNASRSRRPARQDR
jgi:multicomponent K+:H+ antiporter subunit G